MNTHFSSAVFALPTDVSNAPLWYWINERHAIYLRKQILTRAYIPKWADPAHFKLDGDYSADYLTHDAVLRENRFCNVCRALTPSLHVVNARALVADVRPPATAAYM
jgi:hypothetical protein